VHSSRAAEPSAPSSGPPGIIFALRQWRTFAGRHAAGIWFRLRHVFRGVYVGPGLQLVGGSNIHLGPGVVIQRGGALYVRAGGRLVVAEGCRIGAGVVLSVAQSVVIEREVLLAPRCYVSDHNHQFTDPAVPVLRQGMTAPMAVVIGEGSWLGINVCVLAGVTLGRNCVVAANSVVTSSFPDGSVIGGAPARLLRTIPSPGHV
jgi:acetyltransferase-like isoleucine patch superfamily enzyme